MVTIHHLRVKNAALIIGIFFIGLGVFVPVTATLAAFILPETFASSTKILHPAGNAAPLAVAAATIASRTSLDQVITNLNLPAVWGRKYKQPDELPVEKCREMLNRMIQIEVPRRSSIVAIKVFSDDKVEAATIANKLTEIYRRTAPGAAIIEQATPNSVPVRPNKRLNIVLGLFAGVTFLVVGIGLLIASRLAVKRQ